MPQQTVLPVCSGIVAFAACAAPVPAGLNDWHEMWAYQGQSNCLGTINAAAVVPPLPYPEVDFQWDVTGVGGQSTMWEPMTFQTNPARTGSEALFARDMLAAGRELSIAKLAISGKALGLHWIPGTDGYQEYLDKVRDWFPSHPNRYRWQGIVFIGCESDAQDAGLAANVTANFHAMMQGYRSHLGAPNLSIVIARLSNAQVALPFLAQVQAQQDAFVAQDKNAAIFNTDDLVTVDGIHYDDPSQMQLGIRAAAVAPLSYP